MKKIIIISVLFLILVSVFQPLKAYSKDNSVIEIEEEIDEILSEYETGRDFEELKAFSFSDLADTIKENIANRIRMPVKLLGIIILISVINSIVRELGCISSLNTNNDIFSMVCVMTFSAMAVPCISDIFQNAINTIEKTGGYLSVFVPLFSGISVICGGITSSGIYNLSVLSLSEVFILWSENYLVPILSAVMVLGITGSVFPSNSVSSIVELLRKITIWIITIFTSVFTGLTTLKCTVAGKADSVMSKTAKFIVSGAVPVIGGAVSDAYSTVKGSFEVIGGTVGMVGITALLLIMLPPIIELMMYRIVMWIGEAVSEMFSARSLTSLLRSFDCTLSIALCTLVSFSVMFMICSAIMIQGIG